jgi:hypothetical protein
MYNRERSNYANSLVELLDSMGVSRESWVSPRYGTQITVTVNGYIQFGTAKHTAAATHPNAVTFDPTIPQYVRLRHAVINGKLVANQ